MKLNAKITQGEHRGMGVKVQREYWTGQTLVAIEYAVGDEVWTAFFGQFEII